MGREANVHIAIPAVYIGSFVQLSVDICYVDGVWLSPKRGRHNSQLRARLVSEGCETIARDETH